MDQPRLRPFNLEVFMSIAPSLRVRHLGLLLALNLARSASAGTICSEANLRAAVAQGGEYLFTCDATIPLASAIIVETNVVLNAAGHQVVLSGENAVRIFEVRPGASLTLLNLTLANGFVVGPAGTTNGPTPSPTGGVGQGGAVRVFSATFIASSCAFSSNQAKGGEGQFQFTPYAGGEGQGGAIFASNSTLRLTNCSFMNNTALGGKGGDWIPAPPDGRSAGSSGGIGRGGALATVASDLQLDGIQFEANRSVSGTPGNGLVFALSATYGGAVNLVGGGFAASRCNWQGNSATAGGAVFKQSGVAQFSGCVFEYNSASSGTSSAGGGAISSSADQLGLHECLVRSNVCMGGAGSVYFHRDGGSAGGGGVDATGSIGVTNTAFLANTVQGGTGEFALTPGPANPGSAYGAGLWVRGSVEIRNCTFALNSAIAGVGGLGLSGSSSGGGLLTGTGTVNVAFSTIASNRVADSYAPFLKSSGGGISSGGTLLLNSCILAGNFANGGGQTGLPANAYGPITDTGHNLSSDATPALSGAGSIGSIDPRLRPLAMNDGPTPTMALLSDSPAIDHGDISLCPGTDQRGQPRPMLLGCDIGAFELAPPVFRVTRPSLPGPGMVRLEGIGSPETPFRVLASTDLTNWTSVTTGVVDSDGHFNVIAPAGITLQRFYRTAAP